MLINNQVVNTPIDDPVQFDPDWRHKIALICANNQMVPLPSGIAGDKYIQKHVRYLRRPVSTSPVRGVDRNHYLALRWYEAKDTDVKYYLEALLLTEQPFSTIALDMGTYPEAVKLYERLFFACRDSDGRPHKSNVPRTLFAEHIPAQGADKQKLAWKFWATNMGYTYLVRKWGWANPNGDPEDIWTRHLFSVGLAQEEFTAKLLSGKVSSTDLAMFVRGYFDKIMMQQDEKLEQAKGQLEGLGFELLKLLAPKIIPAAKEQLLLAAQARVAKSTKAVESDISKVEIADNAAAGANALQLQLRAKLRGPTTA